MTTAAEIIRDAIAETKVELLKAQNVTDIIAEGLTALKEIRGSKINFTQSTTRDKSMTFFNVESPHAVQSLTIRLDDDGLRMSDAFFRSQKFTNDTAGAYGLLQTVAEFSLTNNLIRNYEPKQETASLTTAEAAIHKGLASAKAGIAAKSAVEKAERDAALARDAKRDFETEVDKTLMGGLRFLREISDLRLEFSVAAVSPGSKNLTITTNIPGDDKDDVIKLDISPERIYIETSQRPATFFGLASSVKNDRNGNRKVLGDITRKAALHGLTPA